MKKLNKIGQVSGTGPGESNPLITFTTFTTRKGETLCCYSRTPAWGDGPWHAWPRDTARDKRGRQAHANGRGYKTAYGALRALRALNA